MYMYMYTYTHYVDCVGKVQFTQTQFKLKGSPDPRIANLAGPYWATWEFRQIRRPLNSPEAVGRHARHNRVC